MSRWAGDDVTDAEDLDPVAALTEAIERYPALVPLVVTIEPDDRYAYLVLTLRHGATEVLWGDGFTAINGEFSRYEGFLPAREVADQLDVLRRIDEIDGRVGCIESEGECLVRFSLASIEHPRRWFVGRRRRDPALRVEYAQVSWATGVDPTERVTYSDTYVYGDNLRDELDALDRDVFRELGEEIPVEWLPPSEAAAAADRFTE